MILTIIQPLFIGTTELILIAGVALLIFGGKKLPEMMRGMGQGVKEFKKGMHEVSEPIEEVKDAVKDAADPSTDEPADLAKNNGTATSTHSEAPAHSDGTKPA